MIRNIAVRFLTSMLFMTLSFAAFSQDAPRWVTKGVKSLNEQRTNDTYTIESFNSYNFQLELLEKNSADVLKRYVVENYGANPSSVAISQLTEGTQPTYEVEYINAYDQPCTIIAKRIDTYSKFDDYEMNIYQFEYYQLYAISRPNVMPVFDNFSLTNIYKGETITLSLIPGMAQLYKGQDTKAYVIIGGEVLLAGAAFYFDYMRRDCAKMRVEHDNFANSWRSKERAWKTFEIGAVSAFVLTYIYNVVDGITSKGARQVKVSKGSGYDPKVNFSLTPYAAPDYAGMAITMTF